MSDGSTGAPTSDDGLSPVEVAGVIIGAFFIFFFVLFSVGALILCCCIKPRRDNRQEVHLARQNVKFRNQGEDSTIVLKSHNNTPTQGKFASVEHDVISLNDNREEGTDALSHNRLSRLYPATHTVCNPLYARDDSRSLSNVSIDTSIEQYNPLYADRLPDDVESKIVLSSEFTDSCTRTQPTSIEPEEKETSEIIISQLA